MAKRIQRGAGPSRAESVIPLYPHTRQAETRWSPVEDDDQQRDQSYVHKVRPRSDNQQALLTALRENNLTLAVGPAGTGKTYLAISAAVEALDEGQVARIILSRPAVEAGESLGYLPGDLQEKMAPYLRPLYDALSDRMGGKRLKAAIADGTVEVAPIAYMRGRTLNNAFVVIDEAQNCTYGQIIRPWSLPATPTRPICSPASPVSPI
jgi:phosphate starvation-inducible protein PhoH and related proteins